MIRTSPFPFEVDFGVIGSTHLDVFSFKTPYDSKGCTRAIVVTNVNNNTLKMIPVQYPSVALLRMKTTSMSVIQMEMMRVMKECDMKLLHTNGACEDIDCYWEGIVKHDSGFISTFTAFKNEKKGMIENALILFLDLQYTRFKKLVEKQDLEWLIRPFLSLKFEKGHVINELNKIINKRKSNSEVMEIAQYIHSHVI